MPIVDKRDRNNWYNTIRIQGQETRYNPITDPNFSVDRMKENEYVQDNKTTLAKIPRIENRIFTHDSSGKGMKDVEFLSDVYPDPETGETLCERIAIGENLWNALPGMMVVYRDTYYNYFDREGHLYNDPLKKRKEKEAQEAAAKAREEKQCIQAEQNKPTNGKKNENSKPKGDERTVDKIREDLLKKEQLLDRKIQQVEQNKQQAEEALRKAIEFKDELEEMVEAKRIRKEEYEEDHLELLCNILQSYQDTVDEQAKRKPGNMMSFRQIQMINELLRELREQVAGSNASDYLQLAEEPVREDLQNHPGTTYGEMALILCSYYYTIRAFQHGKLYEKMEK